MAPAPARTARPLPPPANGLEHVEVWRQPGHYGGWPANHGIWIWRNEILVGFSDGRLKPGDPDRHPIDRDQPERHLLARSGNGGRHWAIELHDDLVPPPQPGHIAGVPTEPGGNVFCKHEVEVGTPVGEQIPVLGGLTAGELVVVSGAFRLKAEHGKASAQHDH